MSSIYFLNSGDFGQQGNHLAAITMPGISLVMFHTTTCSHCIKFIPEFKMLPGTIRGVNFGLCNVDDDNRQLVAMAKHSTTPITSVPKFVLYNEGMPYVEYSGQRNIQAIAGFLQEMISKLGEKQTFTRPRRTRQPMDQQPNSAGPTRPTTMMDVNQDQQASNAAYKITPSTGVKEYETSYGRPYNTLNESDFLEYEGAYKQQMKK